MAKPTSGLGPGAGHNWRLAAVALLLLAQGFTAQAEPAGGDERVRLLVRFRSRPGAAERRLVEAREGRVRREFPEIGVLAIEVSRSRAAELARHGAVLRVEEDLQRWPLSVLSAAELRPTLQNGLYGLVTTRAVVAQARGVSGAGAAVCIADTGIDAQHPDIAPNYRGGIDTVDDDANPDVGADPQGAHATHVAGIAAAPVNGLGVHGVAFNAELYVARVLGKESGTISDILDGVRHLVDVRGCRVVNLSLGSPQGSDIEEQFFTDIVARTGVVIVAAAGNDGGGQLIYPAAYPSVLAVGAVDSRNRHADFSDTGDNLFLSAPGVGVLSSVSRGSGHESRVASGKWTYPSFGLDEAGTTAGTYGKLINCRTGNQAAEFPAQVAGNIAVIQRGGEFFSTKVQNAMDAGATAVVIYNNVPGDFAGTLQTATAKDGSPWPPAVSVSDTAGGLLLRLVGRNAEVVNAADDWDYFTGTSMAAPHVTGVVGLLLAIKPTLDREGILTILRQSAIDLGKRGYDSTYGWGLVNADGAARLAARP